MKLGVVGILVACVARMTAATQLPLDVIFLMDRSGSMQDDIAMLQMQIPLIFSTMQMLRGDAFRAGLVAYGQWFARGEPRIAMPLTKNQAAFTNAVQSLQAVGSIEPGFFSLKRISMNSIHGHKLAKQFPTRAGYCVIIITNEPNSRHQNTPLVTQLQATNALLQTNGALFEIGTNNTGPQGYWPIVDATSGTSHLLTEFIKDNATAGALVADVLHRCVEVITPQPTVAPSSAPSDGPTENQFICEPTPVEFACYRCGGVLECYIDSQGLDDTTLDAITAHLLSSQFCQHKTSGAKKTDCGRQNCKGEVIIFTEDKLPDPSCPIIDGFQCRHNNKPLDNFVTYSINPCDFGDLDCSAKCNEPGAVCECKFGNDVFCDCEEEESEPPSATPSYLPTAFPTVFEAGCIPTPVEVACYRCKKGLECYINSHGLDDTTLEIIEDFLLSEDFCVHPGYGTANRTLCAEQRCAQKGAVTVFTEDHLPDTCPVIGEFRCQAPYLPHATVPLTNFATYLINPCDLLNLKCSKKCKGAVGTECECKFGDDVFCICDTPEPSEPPSVTPSISPTEAEPGCVPAQVAVACYKCGRVLECYIDSAFHDQITIDLVTAFLLSEDFCPAPGNNGLSFTCAGQRCKKEGKRGGVIVYNAEDKLPDTCPVIDHTMCDGELVNQHGIPLDNFATYLIDPCDLHNIDCGDRCTEGTCDCDHGEDVFCICESEAPSTTPSYLPTSLPTTTPSYLPTSLPTTTPSYIPTNIPTSTPSYLPSETPTEFDPGCLPAEVAVACYKCGAVLECYIDTRGHDDTTIDLVTAFLLSEEFCPEPGYGGTSKTCANQQCKRFNKKGGIVVYEEDMLPEPSCPIIDQFMCKGTSIGKAGIPLQNFATYLINPCDLDDIHCSQRCNKDTCDCEFGEDIFCVCEKPSETPSYLPTAIPSSLPTTDPTEQLNICTPFEVACYKCGGVTECYVPTAGRSHEEIETIMEFILSPSFCIDPGYGAKPKTVCAGQVCKVIAVYPLDDIPGGEETCPVVDQFLCQGIAIGKEDIKLDNFATYVINHCDTKHPVVEDCSKRCNAGPCKCEFGEDFFCPGCDIGGGY